MKFNFEWIYLIYALIIFLIFIGVRFILHYLRKNTIKHLNELLYVHENYFLYHELLSKKRLRLILRKELIDIFHLNGYLHEGNTEKIKKMFMKLDQARLEPYEKLEYYQKRFSYFVEQNNKAEAKNSLRLLKSIFKKDNEITKEADLIYNIYILHDTSLIPELIAKIDKTSDKIMKGITQYRIAKLYFYDKNYELVDFYLNEALENVKGSYWYPIVVEAKKDKRILAKK